MDEQDPSSSPAPVSPWALCDAVTARGFRLGGLHGVPVESSAQAHDALAEARAAGATLIVVTEQVASWLREAGELPIAGPLPMVAVVPAALGPTSSPSAGARLALRVRQVLGLPSDPAQARPGG